MQRVSLDPNGQQIGVGGGACSISAYGRFVSFGTFAALLPNDTNNNRGDVYLIDTDNGALDLISTSYLGTSGNSDSTGGAADISDDGRMVVFTSSATDMVPGLSGFMYRVFVRDRALGTTSLASVSSTGIAADGIGAARISGDGRYVTFVSQSEQLFPGDANNALDIFVRDLQAGTTELVSISTSGTTGNSDSGSFNGCDISRDGRFVVFESLATDLVAGYTPVSRDIYVRDRLLGVTSVVSRGSAGQPGNGVSTAALCSDDGQIIGFSSSATNLVAGDTNGVQDAFVHDRSTGFTQRVSVGPLGVQANAKSVLESVSPDGRYIGVFSAATNLVPNDTNNAWDVFVHDRVTQHLQRISVNSSGVEANGDSNWIALSRDAAELVFQSAGNNLVPFDTNGATDVFQRACTHSRGYCTAKINSLGCTPMMSAAGIARASGTQPFFLRAQQVLNQKAGMLIYSTTGQNAAPFAGGTLCVLPPVRRTPAQNSGGSMMGSDCTGTYSLDFNAWIASGSNPALIPGATVWAQYWSRDPGFPPPSNAGLTDAQTFLIWP